MITKTTKEIAEIFMGRTPNPYEKQEWVLKEELIKYLEERKELYSNYHQENHWKEKKVLCSCVDIDTELTTIQLKIKNSPSSLTEQNVKVETPHHSVNCDVLRVVQDSNEDEDINNCPYCGSNDLDQEALHPHDLFCNGCGKVIYDKKRVK